jgi:hypothetical protein
VNLDSDEIRKWLLGKPRPELVRVTTSEGETEDLDTSGNVRWRSVAETICALDPMRLEVHAGGKIIRAEKIDNGLAKTAEVPDMEEELKIPPILSTDPETARLTHFANLLFQSTMFSQKIAFTEMVKLTGLLMNRMQEVEVQKAEAERDYQDEADARLQDAYENLSKDASDPQKDILTAFMQSMGGMGASAEKPNGKG